MAGFVDTTAIDKLQALGSHGERQGACSYHVSKQAQKTRESWLLTFWLLTLPSPLLFYIVSKSVLHSLYCVKKCLIHAL